MKIQPRYFIAAPFLALAGVFAFSFMSSLGRTFQQGWLNLCLMLVLGGIMIGATAVPGYLALKRRWEEFVKIVGFFVAFILFSLISSYTRGLEKVVEGFVGPDYPLLGALWGGAVIFSPFVISIAAYRRFVPLIIRRIDRTRPHNHHAQ